MVRLVGGEGGGRTGRYRGRDYRLAGVHGHEDRRTEVPRRTLVSELKAQSTYFTTQRVTRGLGQFTAIDPRARKPAWSAWKPLAASDA